MKRRPFIWLQEDETEGTTDCGCRVTNPDGRGVQVHLCVMHEAAPKMLAALMKVKRVASNPAGKRGVR